MATIQHKSHDRTVATISERNAIQPRTPGMMVLVRDAIGDPYAGSGRAVYRWDEVQASWILMFKDNVETLTFTGESKTISQDHIQLSFVPANGQVWDVMVRDGLVVHQVEHSVAGSVVTIQPDTPGQFDGKQLSVRYAYGTMTQQLDLEIARVVGEAVGAFDKEAVGLGRVDNTTDLEKPISTAAQTALDGKEAAGTADAAMAAHTSAADPHPQYVQDGDARLSDARPALDVSAWAKAATKPSYTAAEVGALPLSGGTMTGGITFAAGQTWPTWNQSTSGNAATATKLETPRSINGVAFDGSEDITIPAGGLQYLTEVRNVTTPNASRPVHGVTVNGTAADIDLVLAPKGTGAIVADQPDDAVTGGLKRGANAVDLQLLRGNATQVAGGACSCITGGSGNSANGNYSCVAGGSGNYANGNYSCVAGGSGNMASNDGTTVSGGSGNYASGSYSCIPGGRYATTNSLMGVLAYGFNSTALGQHQMTFWGGRQETTTATATRITANAASATAANQLALRTNSAFRVRGTVVARNTTTNDSKEWTFEALIKRGANAAATALVGTPSVTSTFADTAAESWAIALSADTTNGALAITATGAAAATIRWTAVVHSIEVA